MVVTVFLFVGGGNRQTKRESGNEGEEERFDVHGIF
jgi:hypothetical protein